MKLTALLLLFVFFTGCSQNVGYGLGVAGVSSTGNNIAATEIVTDSETGIHGSVTVGTAIRI